MIWAVQLTTDCPHIQLRATVHALPYLLQANNISVTDEDMNDPELLVCANEFCQNG